MRLSAEQFTQITHNPAIGEQLKGEKRGATRIPLGRRSTALMEGMRLSVVIREVSITGASLMTSIEVPADERLVLFIPTYAGTDLQMKCSVVRCERGTGGRVFIVGLRFDEILRNKKDGEQADVARIREAMLGA